MAKDIGPILCEAHIPEGELDGYSVGLSRPFGAETRQPNSPNASMETRRPTSCNVGRVVRTEGGCIAGPKRYATENQVNVSQQLSGLGDDFLCNGLGVTPGLGLSRERSKMLGLGKESQIEDQLTAASSREDAIHGRDQRCMLEASQDAGSRDQEKISFRNAEQENAMINSGVQDYQLCDVPIIQVDGANAIFPHIQEGRLKKKRGRPKKQVSASVKVSASYVEFVQTDLALDLDATAIAERAWDIGKVLGVSNSNNDRVIINSLAEMETRDQCAIDILIVMGNSDLLSVVGSGCHFLFT
ncbi:putative exopolygalacturonase-like [Sesbania bispinosa]|nr:putative exopolygalacturonase-like [Sesbania bispinosa]